MPTVADLARTCQRLVVLEALNDDQNVGAIARASRAFGIDGMIISPNLQRSVPAAHGQSEHG